MTKKPGPATLLTVLGAGACALATIFFIDANRSSVPEGTAHSCQTFGDGAEISGESDLAWVEGGTFVMGSDRYYPEERPPHEVSVAGFWIDRHEVTNREFAEFVEATGYVTVAERQPKPEDYPNIPAELLEPGAAVFVPPMNVSAGGDITQWWRFTPGANWRRPKGPESNIGSHDNYPVVQVAYEDALAYAKWKGRELPTEAQWEFAALGGQRIADNQPEANRYKDGKWTANTWQGIFPVQNTKSDGYEGAAPVGCFEPNGYGLYDMIGNVWEITADAFTQDHGAAEAAYRAPARITIKGGSYLCAENFCARYRPTARQPQDADLGASHIGFRTVKNLAN